MFKVFNQYFPHQLLILLVSESVLILLIWGGVAFQFGAWDAMTLPSLVFRALAATAICQLCLYYADGYDLRSIRSRGEVFFRLIQVINVFDSVFVNYRDHVLAIDFLDINSCNIVWHNNLTTYSTR